MSFPDYFRFWFRKWLANPHVRRMTPAQRGAYIDLLAHAAAEDDVGLPDDDAELAYLSGLYDNWAGANAEAIRARFYSEDGRLLNRTLLKEYDNLMEWREKGRQGGLKSVEAKAEHRAVEAGFEQFWKKYPRKVGRGGAVRAFNTAIRKTDLDTIMAGLKIYAVAMADTEQQYIAHPATWLNQERWADDPKAIGEQRSGRL